MLVAVANVKGRIGQSVMIAIIIALSVLLLFTGLGLVRELNGPFEKMYEAQKGSDFMLFFDTRIHDLEDIQAWWRARPEVAVVSEAVETVELKEASYFQGEKITTFFYVSERPTQTPQQDVLRILEGESAAWPQHGEVWVTSALANAAGVEVGDVLEIPATNGLRGLTVSAVVVDPQFSAPFNNPSQVWIAPGELALYFPVSQLNEVAVGVRLKHRADADGLWTQFLAHLGGSYSGRLFNYQIVRSGYTAPYGIMAVMLVGFSVLSLMVAVFTLYGTITSSIYADFKIIGILRAQGFRPQDVRRIYQLQYLCVALVAVPIGLALGIWAVQKSVTLLLSATGVSASGSSLLMPAAMTFLAFLGFIGLLVNRAAKRAEAVRPVDAIRYGGATEHKAHGAGVGIRKLQALSLPLIVAIKGMVLQKRRALFLSLTILFTVLASSLAVNLNYSLEHMMDDLALFGFDSGQVRVNRSGKRFSIRHEDFMAEMSADHRVAAVSTWDLFDALIKSDGELGTRTLIGTIISGDPDGVGFLNIRGRNPHTADEVSLAVNTARDYAKDVGDEVTLYLSGQAVTFRVVGVFQSVNNGGTGFRFRLKALQSVSPLATPNQYTVMLNEGVDATQFISSLEAKWGEAVDAQPGNEFIKSMMESIMVGMKLTNGFLAFIFLTASAVVIFNSTLMNIAENRRMFGILKSVGMTPNQLRLSVVYGVGLQAIMGIAAGLAIWWWGAPALMSSLFAGLGLVEFPLQNSIVGTVIMVLLVLGFCLLFAWIPSNRLLQINPRNLIVE